MSWFNTDVFVAAMLAMIPAFGILFVLQSKAETQQNNAKIESKWSASSEALRSFVPQPADPLLAESVKESLSYQTLEQQRISSQNGKVVWCVIGEFNSQEALNNLRTACTYFRELGRPALAEKLWAAAVEEYGLKVKHER